MPGPILHSARQIKIFYFPFGYCIREGLASAYDVDAIMEFLTNDRLHTRGTDIQGNIIMFLQLICLLASLFQLYLSYSLHYTFYIVNYLH